MSEPDDLLCRSGYFLAAVFAAPCWLRVTLRPEEKTDAGTAAAPDSAAESWPSSGPTVTGEVQLSREEKTNVFYFTFECYFLIKMTS